MTSRWKKKIKDIWRVYPILLWFLFFQFKKEQVTFYLKSLKKEEVKFREEMRWCSLGSEYSERRNILPIRRTVGVCSIWIMQIIFTVGINKGHQLPWTPVLLLLLIITTQSQNCEPFSLQTSFTRCLIKLDLCSGDPSIVPVSSPHYYRFQSCQITHCITMGADSQCKNSVSIQLEEQECYKSCC